MVQVSFASDKVNCRLSPNKLNDDNHSHFSLTHPHLRNKKGKGIFTFVWNLRQETLYSPSITTPSPSSSNLVQNFHSTPKAKYIIKLLNDLFCFFYSMLIERLYSKLHFFVHAACLCQFFISVSKVAAAFNKMLTWNAVFFQFFASLSHSLATDFVEIKFQLSNKQRRMVVIREKLYLRCTKIRLQVTIYLLFFFISKQKFVFKVNGKEIENLCPPMYAFWGGDVVAF